MPRTLRFGILVVVIVVILALVAYAFREQLTDFLGELYAGIWNNNTELPQGQNLF